MNLEIGASDRVVTASLAEAIDNSPLLSSLEDIDPAEAPEQFAQVVADVLQRAINLIPRITTN